MLQQRGGLETIKGYFFVPQPIEIAIFIEDNDARKKISRTSRAL
jgi:hypothetical protein